MRKYLPHIILILLFIWIMYLILNGYKIEIGFQWFK
nr:MAG TPA: hypothetical protein [Caudoviricetes sp.]